MPRTFLACLVKKLHRASYRSGSDHKRRQRRSCRSLVEQLEVRALLSAGAATAAVAHPPVLAGVGGTLTYMKGGNQLLVAPNLTVSDADSSTLQGATVSVANWQSGDRLGFYNTAALHYSFTENLSNHTAVLSFSGTQTLSAYQQELRSLAFFNVAASPSTATRVVQINVTDGTALSNTVSENIRVGTPPVVQNFGGSLTYVKGGSPLSFASNVAIVDSASSNLVSATVSFTNWQSGDRLNFTNPSALQHQFIEDLTNHTATLKFTGTASLAAYQADLRTMTFSNVAGAPVTSPRTVTLQVSDGMNVSNPVSETITFGQAPALSGFSGTLTYTQDGSTLRYASSIAISAPGTTTLSGATVSFVNWQAGDRVSFTNSAGLQYSYTEDLTAHTYRLTLTGTATVAAYQAELRSLGFFNVAGTPNTTTRTARIQVNSHGAFSNVVSENIAFKVVAPTVSISSATVTQQQSGNQSLPFTVKLTKASSTAVTVKYATSDQTAKAGTDYTAVSGTLTIPAGQTTATINVPILAGPAGQPTKTFLLTLSNPTNATLSTATATGTINSPARATLADNTANPSNGTRLADSTHFFAAAFTTGSSFSNLQSVSLLMNSQTAGSVKVSVFTGTDAPSTLAGTLKPPATITSGLALNTFTADGFILVPNTKYWVVLQPTSGAFNWSFTNSTTGTGPGFLTQWASSTNAGQSWTTATASSLQMSVNLVAQ